MISIRCVPIHLFQCSLLRLLFLFRLTVILFALQMGNSSKPTPASGRSGSKSAFAKALHAVRSKKGMQHPQAISAGSSSAQRQSGIKARKAGKQIVYTRCSPAIVLYLVLMTREWIYWDRWASQVWLTWVSPRPISNLVHGCWAGLIPSPAVYMLVRILLSRWHARVSTLS